MIDNTIKLGTVVEARHCPQTGPYVSADTLSAHRYELSADRLILYS